MMFRLQLPTDPRWVNIAEMNVEDILTDHAYCEQKAATTALSLMLKYYDYPEIVQKMSELVKEEIEHFQKVHQFILNRGLKLGKDQKDEYVNELRKKVILGGDRHQQLMDSLLIAAIIEARSCERFKILSQEIQDIELATFYKELMESEAAHYTMFITLARENVGREKVDQRWSEILKIESDIIQKLSNSSRIHG